MRIILFFNLLFLSLASLAGPLPEDIPYPFYENQQDVANELLVLDRGEEALQKRLELIQNARKSIEVEYYIYATDMAGKIFTRELVKAAERGVKVRILVDKLMSVHSLHEYYAKELAQHGIEVKYYNTSLLIKLSTIHYRNHRKLLVVDDTQAITGGRNMANEYFNLGETYNFEDRDVYVKGPIVKAMRESFETFYNHKISHTISFPKEPLIRHHDSAERLKMNQYLRLTAEARAFLEETPEEVATREEIERIAALQAEKHGIHVCRDTTFASDAPGANFIKASSRKYRDNFRHLRKVIQSKMSSIDRALTISSPYFIANDSNQEIFEGLLAKGVKVSLYTNSLKSTDAIVIASNFYLHLSNWLKQGMSVYLHDGHWSAVTPYVLSPATEKRWGTHAKTHVYESSTYSEVMIGTYNIDNRSDFYNTELALFCKGNDDLTAEVKEDVVRLEKKGMKVESLSAAINRHGRKTGVTGASPMKRLKMDLITLPSWMIDDLL